MTTLNALQGFICYGYVCVSTKASKTAKGSLSEQDGDICDGSSLGLKRTGAIAQRDNSLATNIPNLGNKVTDSIMVMLSNRALNHIPYRLVASYRAFKAPLKHYLLVTFLSRVTEARRKVTKK